MTLQTGTPGDDDLFDNLVFAADTYDGGAGTDTLHLQVASDALLGPAGLSSPYSLYSTTGGVAPLLVSSLTSIERLEFDSTAGTSISAGIDGSGLAASGLTELIGGAGTDTAVFLFSGASSITMPSTLTLTNWSSAPTDAWNANVDSLVLTEFFEQPTQSYTLNAASGLGALQRLIGGIGSDTINGSANADVLAPGSSAGQTDMNAVDALHGNGGNDSIEIISSYLAAQTTPFALTTNAASIFDGGAGTDVLTIGGHVVMQSTLVSIEGVNLLLAVAPQTVPVLTTGRLDAVLTLDSAHAAMLPSNAFFTGGGTVSIDVTNGIGFDGSSYVITPTQAALDQGVPITFDINGEDGNGLAYVGTSASDTITFGKGAQTATGGAGADIFVADQGTEVITDFTPGVDKIDVSAGGISNIYQLRAFASQVGGDTVASYEGGTLTFKGVSLGSLSAGDFIFAAPLSAPPTDVDGNGTSDVLFRSASGGVAVWQLNEGGSFGRGGAIGDPGSNYRIAATGDFNGDGRADILFQGRDGSLASWDLDGSAISNAGILGNPGPNHALVGTGDFNGDGTSDALFLNAATGAYAMWNIAGGAVVGGGTIGNPGSGWVYKATADFNGDGQADILFENEGGGYAIWELGGTSVIGGGAIGDPGAGWFFKGTGDFNGDGKADILFENGAGTYAIWDLNGTQIAGGGAIGNPGANFTLAGIGDYNGDGTSDLLFRAADGTLATWTLDDNQIIGGSVLGNPGSGYAVASGHGANAFGVLVFQDSAGGALSSVLVGSDSAVSSGTLSSGGATALATGDFAGTGEVDVLLGDSAGNLSYVVNGAPLLGGTIGNPGADYSFVALGDFNGDGKSDILFQNTVTGAYSTWDIAGGHIAGSGTIGMAAGYSFVGAADINGDGKADIIFRNNATGDYADWLLSDTTIIGGGTIGNPGSDWQFKGLGDLNGDGKADMVFENSAGLYASWDLDGTAVIGGGAIGTPGGTFQLAKITDLNQDGRADLLFVDGSGHYASWLLVDNTILGGASLGALAPGQHVI